MLGIELGNFEKLLERAKAKRGVARKNSREQACKNARKLWISEVSFRTEVKQDHELLPEDLEQLVKDYKALCGGCAV